MTIHWPNERQNNTVANRRTDHTVTKRRTVNVAAKGTDNTVVKRIKTNNEHKLMYKVSNTNLTKIGVSSRAQQHAVHKMLLCHTRLTQIITK